MVKEDLAIEGMTCGHCAMGVKKELSKLPGVQVESVEIGKARVLYDESHVTLRDLEQAIHNAGYRVQTR